MSKRQLLILLGIWTAIFPFLGFPSSWDNVLAVLTGLLIIAMTYGMRTAGNKNVSGEANIARKAEVTFVEHKVGDIININS